MKSYTKKKKNTKSNQTIKVEVNKDGQIEVNETEDVLNAAVAKALESEPLKALPLEKPEDIEQIIQDISETTDITASPTDSYNKSECLNTETPSINDQTGNDSALGESATEVSLGVFLLYLYNFIFVIKLKA